MTRPLVTALVAACAFAALAQPASATTWRSESVAVSYLDLDLSREHAAEMMLRRLTRAAQRVCGNADRRRTSLGERVAFNGCVSETLGAAVAALDAPLVTRIYAGRPTIVIASR